MTVRPLMFALAVIALWPTDARAEPRFAVREGTRCSHCHVNRTGGGMRTPFGITFAESSLSTYRLKGVFDPHLGDSISMGANLRLQNRTLRYTKTTLDGVTRQTTSRNSFEMNEANLYVLADLIPAHLQVYVDETIAPEAASNREAFVLVRGLPANGYVKAGRFMLPFGLRIPDDAAFIRAETGFNYANSDLGVELGAEPGPMDLSLVVSNGTLGGADTNRRKQITANATFVSSFVRAGLSFAWNDASTEDFDFQSITSGAHLGGRLGRLTLLSEIDWIHGITDPDSYNQLAFFHESNFEVQKGLFARFRFEAFDPLRSLDNNARDRFVAEVSWFPIQLLEVRAAYRFNRDIPQRPEANADEVVFQVHGFL